MTTEQLQIRALAREFAEGEIRPGTAGWDERRELDEEVFGKLAELGFLGMLVPEAYGGLGLDPVTYVMALEELSWGDASVALTVAVQNGPVAGAILRRGSEEQKERWLPDLASGRVLGAFALSEPEAGSDASAIRTRAVREGEVWRLSGTKRWVTNGERAGLVLVFARTEEASEGPDGIGAFLVERGSEGYRVGRRERTMGLRASETVEIHLEDVPVAASGLLGESAAGFRYAMESLVVARVSVAAQALGIAQAAFEHSTRYSLEREQFGTVIADFGAIREKLAVMAAKISAARALTHEAARRIEREGGGVERSGFPRADALSAMAKLTASEAAMWVADEAVQIYGGYGYMRDYPVEKLMRDAKGPGLYEGTNEIMRHVIAREVIRDARSPEG